MVTQKRVTIQDVAKEAGVSKQTVSRVINDHQDVADNTRDRVKKIISELKFQPDPIARSMKGNTNTLGCITPNLSDYNFSNIVQSAHAEARQRGFLFFTGSAQYEDDIQPLLSEIMNRRVDGLLILNPRDDDRYIHLLPLIEQGFPIVYIKNSPEDEQVSAVCLDDEKGGRLAVNHLLELGHTNIATILGPANEECTSDRLKGYQEALELVGIDLDPELIVQGNWSAQSGSEAVQKLFEQKKNFSAVFAQNDRMAVGAIKRLRQEGLRIPRDISVIGYDDIPLTSFFDPPLTTVRQPMDQFGQIGTEMLVLAIKNPKLSPQIIRLEPELIIRETCVKYEKEKEVR